jgi:hypothetical protein
MMGLKLSPYLAAKAMLRGLECIYGDTEFQANVFHWSAVRHNLSGPPTYNPQLPRVSEAKDVEGLLVLAALLAVYVDDLRAADTSEKSAEPSCTTKAHRWDIWVCNLRCTRLTLPAKNLVLELGR